MVQWTDVETHAAQATDHTATINDAEIPPNQFYRIAPFVPTASVLSVGSPLMSTRLVVARSFAACAPSCVVGAMWSSTRSRRCDVVQHSVASVQCPPAVGLVGAHLQDGAGAALKHRDRDGGAVLLEDLGHADLPSQQSHSHRRTPCAIGGGATPADAEGPEQTLQGRRRASRRGVFQFNLGREAGFGGRVAARLIGDP